MVVYSLSSKLEEAEKNRSTHKVAWFVLCAGGLGVLQE